MRLSRLPFFWRVFVASALVLVAATIVLIATPVTVSANVALIEVVILLAGLCLALLVEFVLLRERALLAGGALAVKPGPGGGVEVRFEVPAMPETGR
jgi:hypothetical protein